MKVKEFYQSSCKDRRFYNSLQENKKNVVFAEAILLLCKNLKNKKNRFAEITAFLEEKLPDEEFLFSWQKKKEIEDLMGKLQRFLQWLETVEVAEVLEYDVDVSIPFISDCLKSKVHLIFQKRDGNFGAINLFQGKSKKSLGGKSIHTNMNTDLHALIAKKVLESRYPGIVIYNVFLSHEDDSMGSLVTALEVGGKRSSNVFSLTYKDFYENGTFQHQKMLDKIAEVVKTPLPKSCFGCPHKRLCDTVKATPVLEEEVEFQPSTYTLPNFTSTQKEVISHKEGPCLVCAGPGSGKTATLVGRIKALLDSGIDPEYILAITFTRDAAGEIKERVASFTNDLPYISTIHALCYDILQKNSSKVGMEVKLLTAKARLSLIETLLEAYEPLTGFSYQLLDGPQGLLRTVERKLDKFFLQFKGVEEEFLEEEKTLGYDFIHFAREYRKICDINGYITFNEQISLCLKLLKEYPEILESYSNIFRYIMVDEFQDIDGTQAELIYLVASHNNLFVVGDDDQSIYGFRGGSHKYMLKFKEIYPSAKVYHLRENFRSTSSLVTAAQSVIESNKERLQKEMLPGRTEQGMAPCLIGERSLEKIEQLIAATLEKGYSYKDIALLSVKNSTLEELAKNMSLPCVIEKQSLVNDYFFGLLHDCVSLYKSKMGDKYSFCHYLKLFGIELEEVKKLICTTFSEIVGGTYDEEKEDPAYQAFRLLHFSFQVLEDNTVSPAFFIQFFSFATELEDSVALPTLMELIEAESIENMEELHLFLTSLVRFQDETRVDVSTVNAVHLITSHESKGREFKVVLLIDDFKAEITEEQRRLYYVAMTRAKDLLYICYDASKESITEKIMAKGGN